MDESAIEDGGQLPADPQARPAELARRQRLHDVRDFNDERAGRETGRRRRFFTRDETSEGRSERRADDLWFFLEAAELTERIAAFRERLDELDRASAEALVAAERRLALADDRLDYLRERAARDEFGRLVFRSADGKRAFYEDGTELTPDAMKAIDFKPGSTTIDAWTSGLQEHKDALKERDQIIDFRDRIKEAQETLGNDPSPEDVAAMEREFAAMPAAVQDRLDVISRRESALATLPDQAERGAAAPLSKDFLEAGLPDALGARRFADSRPATDLAEADIERELNAATASPSAAGPSAP
ncbi:MAG: hypothetical protein AB7I36_20340 [Rhodospirillaceae bacterium]